MKKTSPMRLLQWTGKDAIISEIWLSPVPSINKPKTHILETKTKTYRFTVAIRLQYMIQWSGLKGAYYCK
jgi:hypothetical protein